VVRGIEFSSDADGFGVRKNVSSSTDELPEHPVDAHAPAIRPKMEIEISSVTELQPAQCRAARGFLKWSQAEAAAQLGVGLSLLISFENGRRPQRKNLEKIKAGFEQTGIIFDVEGTRLVVSCERIVDEIDGPARA
jgi:DNA-binding transcriptional regulator YiaG